MMLRSGKPLVTVVTPTLNRKRFLAGAIESVLAQTYPAIDYWIMDGGSSDGTQELLRTYDSPRLRWVSAADKGQSDAINQGWRQGSGEILAWLNDDDRYEPCAIEEAVDALAQSPEAGMVYGAWRSVDSAGLPMGSMGAVAAFDFTEAAAGFICPVPQPAAFVRRSVVGRVGWLDLRLRYCMDFDLWLRVALEAPVVAVNRCWAVNTMHADTKSYAQAGSLAEDYLRCVENLYASPKLSSALRKRRKEARACARLRACWMCIAASRRRAAFRQLLLAFGESPSAFFCSPYSRRYLSFIRSQGLAKGIPMGSGELFEHPLVKEGVNL